MKTSERLISLARQADELSEEECQILDYYVTELKSTVHLFAFGKLALSRYLLQAVYKALLSGLPLPALSSVAAKPKWILNL